MPSNRIRVGLFYNLVKDYPRQEGQAIDSNAEWDIEETVQAIRRGLESNDYEVLDLGNPKHILRNSVRCSIDIVFSICELQGYRFREALVPALCELLGIPYVFSPPDALTISLDKNLCNLLVRQAGCKVPNWYFIKSAEEVNSSVFTDYPYIVKPSAEGSSMGIYEKSVVYDYQHLATQVEWVINSYRQPAIVQRFMAGREFTVAVLESNGSITALEPLEIREFKMAPNFTYNRRVKLNADQEVSFIPLDSEPELAQQVRGLACESFKAIGCRDAARVDIRLSDYQVPFFLEINPLPSLHPEFGDFCRSARASGLGYDELIGVIMRNATARSERPSNGRHSMRVLHKE